MPGRNPAATRTERINRYLSRAGVGSRRRADALILQGRVTLNGTVVEKPGVAVDPDHDTVELDGRPMLPIHSEAIWIVLNKPRDVLTTRRDQRGRQVVFDLLPEEYKDLIPVGRLDYDTQGILILTSDGRAANRLMHPRYEIERVYEALVKGQPSRSALARLSAGLDLGDPTPARADAEIIRRMSPERTVLRIVIREGRKREIKRMMTEIGYPVIRLRRIAYGPIRPQRLGVGRWRELSIHERKTIQRLFQSSDPETA